MDKFETRRLALAQLVKSQPRAGIATVAAKVSKDASYVSRLLYPPGKEGRKRIGEDVWDSLVHAFPQLSEQPSGKVINTHPLADYCPPARYVADLIQGIQDPDLQMHAFIEAVRAIESLAMPHNSGEFQHVYAPKLERNPRK